MELDVVWSGVADWGIFWATFAPSCPNNCRTFALPERFIYSSTRLSAWIPSLRIGGMSAGAKRALHAGRTTGFNWTLIAQECGYYDQARLIAEFNEFTDAALSPMDDCLSAR